MPLRLEVSKGAMSLLAKGAVVADLETMGITSDDWTLATGNRPWIGQDRTRVKRILEVLTFGTIDVIGLPRFEVSAEYLAAVLAMFVHPTNILPACRWMEGIGSAENDMLAAGHSSDPPHGVETVHARQLFALVLALWEDSASEGFRVQFEKRVGIKLLQAQPQGG